MVHDAAEAVANVRGMIRSGRLRSLSGREVACQVQSVCVHGDDPGAVALARALRDALVADGIAVAPLTAMV